MSTPNNKKVGQSASNRTAGRSTTRKSDEGSVLRLRNPIDRGYLCAHVCGCQLGTTLRNSLGHTLKQRCVTARIWTDEEANQLVWRYKAEVGYNMRTNPPAPLMSREQPNRPSRFPLGRAMQEGLLKRDLEGRSQKGLLRIPDCIVLNITGPELAAMRASGHIDWNRLKPIKPNIDTVVEIKFEGDKLGPKQRDAYRKIAGPDRFRLLEARECNCKRQEQEQPQTQTDRQTVTTPVPLPRTEPKRLLDRLSPNASGGQAPAPTPQRPQYGPEAQAEEGTSSLSTFLKSAAVTDGVILVGTIALGVVLAPEAAALGAALLLINKTATQ
jgi:hypothetical protein